jgi:predicted nucleic acid-binding protein
VLSVLLTNIEIVSKEDVLASWGKAEAIMGSVDVDDVPFIAASLSRSCDGIWSDDEHLKGQGLFEGVDDARNGPEGFFLMKLLGGSLVWCSPSML